VVAALSITPGHAQPDLGHAAIRNTADVGSHVSADAVSTICGSIKAARLTFTHHRCAAARGAH
jgi:hypothetical protein